MVTDTRRKKGKKRKKKNLITHKMNFEAFLFLLQLSVIVLLLKEEGGMVAAAVLAGERGTPLYMHEFTLRQPYATAANIQFRHKIDSLGMPKN
mmetsp:Transcript_33648/g.49386  ORF Transcript_33648/g.49386 Transcript_33648/m.49386 type:complete len:93 (-) Transcript_33648:74-352(-)